MSDWTHAGAHLPWLRGQGLHVAVADSRPVVAEALSKAGYALAEVDTAQATSRQDAYRAIAAALYLPGTAGTNLDALVDALSDLSQRWPDAERIVLLWSGAEALVRADLLGWTELAQVLLTASADVWSPKHGRPVVFEVVAFVAGSYGADRP